MSTYEKSQSNTHTKDEAKSGDTIAKKPNRFIILCLTVALIGCVMFSYLFNISEIVVEGNKIIDANIIKIQSKLTVEENILKADTDLARENILKNPWIDTVNITRIFPGTIKITVTECEKISYIKFASNALAIDKNGKILEVIPLSNATDLPVISGVTLSDTTPGEMIDCGENTQGLEILKELITHFSDSEILTEITSIEIDKYHNTTLLLKNGMTVLFGKDNLEYKIAYLEVAYPSNLSHKSGGKFDLSDPNKVILTG